MTTTRTPNRECVRCGARFFAHPYRAHAARYCSAACYSSGPRRSKDQIVARFWQHVNVGPKDQCWVWTGSYGSHGYGQFCVNPGRTTTAHRFSYEIAHKEEGLPRNVFVRHKCDNPKCVNPRHLEPGSGRENSADWHRRHGGNMGERNGMCRLTRGDVKAIVSSTETPAEIARTFGISRDYVYRLRRGEHRSLA